MSNRPIGIDVDRRSDISSRRNDGWAAEQVDDLEFNQAIYQQTTDHVWGFQAQTGAGSASIWTDASGDVFDKDSNPIVFQDQDKILINHDVQAAANLLIKFGQKKVTIEMLSGVTLDMDTFDLTLGESGDSIGGDIILTQTGTLTINGNRGLKINKSRDVYSDFTTKNLITNFKNSETADADADNIIFVDEFGNGKRVNGINETFDITDDRPDGIDEINELPSTVYQCWLDSDLNKAMVPDLVGVADANVLNSLSDSTAAFQTHLVQPGDEIYQTDDLIKGFVKAISTEFVITCMDSSGADLDLFPLGTEGYKIRMLSPVGLGSFRARIFAVNNNSGSDLDDSWYTQIQDEKPYYENGPYATDNFTVTGPNNWSTVKSILIPYQVNDWTGLGIWRIKGNGSGSVDIISNEVITISDIVFDSDANQSVDVRTNAATQAGRGEADIGANTITISSDDTFTTAHFDLDVVINKKPSFHN